MKTILRHFLILMVGAMSLAVPTLAQESKPDANPAGGTLGAIRSRGTLRVGLAMFLPWAMHNEKGELIGFDIDVAKQLGDSLGVEVQYFPVGQSRLIGDLDSGRYDIIVSGLYVTPARALQVNFSDFYSQSDVTLLANRKLASNFHAITDFNKPGIEIGVTAGTLYVEIAKRNFPQASIRELSEEAAAMEAVEKGELNAAVAASPRPEIDAMRFPAKMFLPLAQPLSTQGEAFAVRKGDPDFVNFLNSWIKYHQQNGWLEDRRTFWFKTLNWANDL
jgi:polar amino acid transport system substrate-binding protein